MKKSCKNDNFVVVIIIDNTTRWRLTLNLMLVQFLWETGVVSNKQTPSYINHEHTRMSIKNWNWKTHLCVELQQIQPINVNQEVFLQSFLCIFFFFSRISNIWNNQHSDLNNFVKTTWPPGCENKQSLLKTVLRLLPANNLFWTAALSTVCCGEMNKKK